MTFKVLMQILTIKSTLMRFSQSNALVSLQEALNGKVCGKIAKVYE